MDWWYVELDTDNGVILTPPHPDAWKAMMKNNNTTTLENQLKMDV